MIRDTISAASARRYYDRLGRWHDWAERYEGRARRRALALLAPQAGERILEVGPGTGRDLASIAAAVGSGAAVGVDLSAEMLRITRARSAAYLIQADARRIPLRDCSIDGAYAAYVLDLIPLADLSRVLMELRRVLRADARLVVVSLTDGVTVTSKVVVAAWRTLYRISPIICGGCRPVHLSQLVTRAGFVVSHREVRVQLGVPSEVICAS